MIKVGVLEAATAIGAELIRILLNHPDVELQWAQSSVVQGALSAYIRGITGETDLSFCRMALGEVDAIINCSPVPVSAEMLAGVARNPANVKIIEMAATELPDTYAYGICELNRKTLVRGCMTARHVSPLAMAVELALFPLAKHLMLNSQISVAATIGVSGTRAISRRGSGRLPECGEIADAMRLVQSSFFGNVDIVEMRSGGADGLMAVISMPCPMPIGEIRPLYEKAYEDHSFTYVREDIVDTRDVAGTNKCLLHLDKVDDTLHITAVLDPRIKGGAGNAVHMLNLMFGLLERTGLAIKATPE